MVDSDAIQDTPPPAASTPWRGALLVSTMALLLEALAATVDQLWTGSMGMGAPLLGMVLGIAVGLSAQVRIEPAWLTRATLKQLALSVAGAHFVAGGLLWGASTELSGGGFALGVGAIGLLSALSALVVTLCVGDAVAMVFCPFPEPPSSSQPTGPWRRR